MHDEELRTISVGSRVSHGDSTASIFASEGFVVKFVTWSTSTSASRVTALDHEAIESAMENGVVVEVVFG